MKISPIIIGFLLALSVVSASDYYLEFNQISDKLVIKSAIDNQALTSYVDADVLDKSGSSIYFVKKVNFNQSFENVRIKLNLDKGVIVKDNLIFPADYKIETDGQIISIVWNLKNIKNGDVFAMFVTLEDTNAGFNWAYWILGIFVFVVAAYLIYSKIKVKTKPKFKKHKAKKEIKTKADYDYLLDTEKRVIEELKKADRHELWQKQIQASTGYSKAKVSRLVRNLEARNLVVKIPFGNTNKVRLK